MAVDIQSAQGLLSIMEAQQSTTTWHERAVQSQVALWTALREADRDALRMLIGWPATRDYVIDPLAGKISEAFGDLLFGEDPAITSAQTAAEKERQEMAARARLAAGQAARATGAQPGDGAPVGDSGAGASPPPASPPASNPVAEQVQREADLHDPDAAGGVDEDFPGAGMPDADLTDQDKLDALIEANNLPSELRDAEQVCSSEGEVWWRIYVDPAQSDYPIIEWHSRSHVRPMFRGRRLIAAAFVSEIFREEVNEQWEVWRYLEVHAEGCVLNVLYKGTLTELGTRMKLTDRPETQELRDEWHHSLGMLAGRVPNKLGKDRRYGISDYHGVKDLLLSLNEATTIGHENARLTLKRRVVVPRDSLTEDGQFDASEDVLIADSDTLDTELGGTKNNSKYTVLEYSFDAQALISYKEDLAGIALTRCGIAQQFVNVSGRSAEGMAHSGTALRVRLIPTTLAANGKGRFWDDSLPKVLMLTQQVDALDVGQGGFGREWAMAAEPPVIERSLPLPEDEADEVNRHAMAVGAEIESRRTAISNLNPDWDDTQVQGELEEIDRELSIYGQPAKQQGGGGFGN